MSPFSTPEEEWKALLDGTHPHLSDKSPLRFIPSNPRCRLCKAPFGNPGAAILRRYGFAPWPKNPNRCGNRSRDGRDVLRSPRVALDDRAPADPQEDPLFADLVPADLERVAAIAEERTFTDNETIAREGELGDELYVVTDGTIRVIKGDRVLARRSAGDVVGEMSILTQNPRIASLVADGRVTTLRIGRAAFESMIRERPDLALGVMRVLALRLEESANRGSPDRGRATR